MVNNTASAVMVLVELVAQLLFIWLTSRVAISTPESVYLIPTQAVLCRIFSPFDIASATVDNLVRI